MKKTIGVFLLAMIAVSCSPEIINRSHVSSLGYAPAETIESVVYALPRTALKVSVTFEKRHFIPGPYADYAQKLLGIENVRKERSINYTISNVALKAYAEMDVDQLFTLNQLEGEMDLSRLEWAASQGLVMLGDYTSKELLAKPMRASSTEKLHYTDLSMEENISMQKKTIYKTIITDTSFVEVPVTTEQLEHKTIGKKAEEAANLILELRSDRYYMSAGLLDPYPQDFDLEIALKSLNQMESDYLSLFIGKEIVSSQQIDYYVSPKGSDEDEYVELDMMTKNEGPGQFKGKAIQLHMTPSGKMKSLRNLLPQEPEDISNNTIYYRVPEICDVYLSVAGEILLQERISLFQSGALVNEKY